MDARTRTVGKLLKEASELSGITQREWAEKARFSESYIHKLVSGQRLAPFTTVKRLIDVLPLDAEVKDRLLREATQLQLRRHLHHPLTHIDWGEAPGQMPFYGRKREQERVEHWIGTDRCHIVAVLGLGGVGKTAFARALMEQLESHFECILWRSLYNLPPLEEILRDCLYFLGAAGQVELPRTLEQRIRLLLEYVRERRCLIVFDNVDSIIEDESYREGYEGYGTVLRRIAEAEHQSCLLLTSRVQPPEITFLTGEKAKVQVLQLPGLNTEDALRLLEDKGVRTDDRHAAATLIDLYSGNPLALQIVAEPVRKLFEGNIARFLHLQKGMAIFGGIERLLDQQILPLPETERDVLYWLALECEAVTLETLQEYILPHSQTRRNFLEAVSSLHQRSLLEKRDKESVALQPVILEYVTERLVALVCHEIQEERPDILASHALLLAQAEDYVRESQIRRIIRPVLDRLLVSMDRPVLEEKCKRMLAALHYHPASHSGIGNYVAGNLFNLLVQAGCDLEGYDFSGLAVWGVDLQGVAVHHLNLSYADLKWSRFTFLFDAILRVQFSPDGKWLMGVSTTNEVFVSEVESGMLIYSCQHHEWVYTAALSSDGKFLATGCDDSLVRLWDGHTGELLASLAGHQGYVRWVAFSPDSAILASGSYDQTIRLWDVRTGRLLHLLRSQSRSIWQGVFHPRSFLLASSGDHAVQIWDAQSGSLVRTLQQSNQFPFPLAWSPDGTLLASGDDQNIHVWDEMGTSLYTLEGHDGDWVMSLAFSPDSAILASGGKDQTIRLWDVRTGRLLQSIKGHNRRVWTLAWPPNGETLVSGSDDQTIRFWDPQTGRLLRTWHGRGRATTSVAFRPDGKQLASTSDDPCIWLWNIDTQRLVQRLYGHTWGSWSVAFSPDGTLLASGSDDHTILLWNMQTGHPLHVLEHQGYVWSVAFSPDGTLLASGSDDHTIRLWDTREGSARRVLPGQSCWVWSIAFSPDGTLLASGSDDYTLNIWDIQTGNLLGSWKGHTASIRVCAYCPDGALLASGGDDGTIRLWDIKTGRTTCILRGHSSIIRSVVWSPDGTLLASGSDDQTIRLWDVRTGHLIHILHGHSSRIWSVVWSPDGTLLASGSHDGTIRLWDTQAYTCRAVLQDRPYEGLDITGAKLPSRQKQALQSLGAVSEPV
jgi:WD40 repeat protein